MRPGYQKKRRQKKDYARIPRRALLGALVTVGLARTGAGPWIETAVTSAGSRFEQALSAVSGTDGSPADDGTADPADDPGADCGQLVWESCAPALPAAAAQDGPAPVSVQIDGSSGNYDGSGAVYIKNETDYDIDIPALLSAPGKVRLSGDRVQVLVMHTHGTEAYTPTAANSYTPTDTDRTTDCRYNVVRVGQEICDVLNGMGIPTVHSETLNDSPAYSGSYTRALEDISAYMKENPSIKLVIDVHRDAMVTASGKKYKTVAEIEGQQAAQLMLVCGTDAGGLVHDGWRDNLSFQLQVQQRLNTAYPGIMRPLDLRAARFNQHVTAGSMLLEVGTSGNTLEEALISARIFARTLGAMLLDS